MEFIVIIPALNPEPCLEKLVDRLWELENQVLVVDDGSETEYRESFQRLEKKCIVLHHKENQGKGEAIKTALQFFRGFSSPSGSRRGSGGFLCSRTSGYAAKRSGPSDIRISGSRSYPSCQDENTDPEYLFSGNPGPCRYPLSG